MATGNDPTDPFGELEHGRRGAEGSRVEFREQLQRLDRSLIGVGTRVASAIIPTTEAFLQADTAQTRELEAADQLVARECAELEDACYLLIARESPVAGDLRRAVAVHRSVSDVQRSSNLLRHVAESLTWVHPPSMTRDVRELVRRLGEAADEIFQRGISAWRAHDALAGNELERLDDRADLAQKELLAELYTGTQSVEEAVSLALIARYYERIADHGVELAHNVAYVVTGERPRQSQSF